MLIFVRGIKCEAFKSGKKITISFFIYYTDELNIFFFFLLYKLQCNIIQFKCIEVFCLIFQGQYLSGVLPFSFCLFNYKKHCQRNFEMSSVFFFVLLNH